MVIKKHLFELILMLMIFLTLIFSSGCATQNKSVALGGLLGVGTGAAVGGIIDPGKNGKYRTRNVVIGAAVGGITGSMIGSELHENNERDKQLSYMKGRESNKRTSVPALQNPKVEAIWVDSKVSGNRYIEGHYEYIITEPTRWEAP